MIGRIQLYTLPNTVYRAYTSYFRELWSATNTSARTKIANDKVRTAIREVHDLLQNDAQNHNNSYNNHYNPHNDSIVQENEAIVQAKVDLLKACEHFLAVMGIADEDTPLSMDTNNGRISEPRENNSQISKPSPAGTTSESPTMQGEIDFAQSTSVQPAMKKQHRSIVFGAIMGAVVACWVFSGNYIFAGIFCLITILGQLEYYRMVMHTGVFPARRISVVGATSMFVTVRKLLCIIHSVLVFHRVHLHVRCSVCAFACFVFFLSGLVCARTSSDLLTDVWNMGNDLEVDDATGNRYYS